MATTVAPGMTAEMSEDEFEYLIDAIALHQTAQVAAARRGVAPRGYVLAEGLETDNPDFSKLPLEAKQAIEKTKNDHQSDLEKNKDKIAPLAEERYKGGMSQDDFNNAIDDQTQKNIDAFAKKQREIAERLKRIGQEHPQSRTLIVQAYKAVSAFFTKIWNAVVDFFNHLVDKLIELWNKVKEFFVDAWNKVKDWWNSIF